MIPGSPDPANAIRMESCRLTLLETTLWEFPLASAIG